MAKPTKQKKTLGEKVQEIDPGFAASILTMTVDEIKNELYKMAKYRVEIEEARSSDSDLEAARDRVKMLGEVYSEPLQAIKLKSKLAVECLKAKK
jgi:hypothetical protein